MPKISRKDLQHLAELANLKLSESEKKKYQHQLSEIINYVDELSDVDVTSVKPTSQTTGLTNSLRKDKRNQKASLSTNQALSGTEKIHNDYFLVPAVLERDQ